MKPAVRRLLDEALQLPPEGRAALAGSILDSLDREVDEGAEAAWSSEIRRRVAELETGKSKAVPWSKARRMILAKPDARARS